MTSPIKPIVWAYKSLHKGMMGVSTKGVCVLITGDQAPLGGPGGAGHDRNQTIRG